MSMEATKATILKLQEDYSKAVLDAYQSELEKIMNQYDVVMSHLNGSHTTITDMDGNEIEDGEAFDKFWDVVEFFQNEIEASTYSWEIHKNGSYM